MSEIFLGIAGVIAFLVLMALGMPVGFTLLLVGFGGLLFLLPVESVLDKLAFVPFDTLFNYDFAALPLYLFMAYIVSYADLTRGLFNIAGKWLGPMPGGIAMATVGGSAMFAAVTSSSLACAATMSAVALPEMKKYKYDIGLSTGTIACAGTLGVLIPPSGALIFYGIFTGTSIGQLFAAGIMPGILEAGLYVIAIYIVCRWRPSLGPKGPATSWKEKIVSLGGGGEVVALVALSVVGILVGWFTPSEGGAVGAAGAIVITLLRRKLSWGNLKQAIVETIKITGMLYVILIGGFMFMFFMGATKLPLAIAEFVTSAQLSPVATIGAIVITYIILGMFLDTLSMMLLTVPVFLPVIVAMGYSPIWFGIMVTMLSELATESPPVGMLAYAVAALSDVPVTTVFKGEIPFLLANMVQIGTVMVFPIVALFLPNLLF